MKIKKGVILAGIGIQMNPVLVEAEKLWEEKGAELVITSGLDGKHSLGSLHYTGYALDLLSRYFPKKENQQIRILWRQRQHQPAHPPR